MGKTQPRSVIERAAHRQRGVQDVVLGHEPDPVAQLGVVVIQVTVVVAHAAAGGRAEPGQRPQQRGFTGPAGPHHRQQAALGQGKADIGQQHLGFFGALVGDHPQVGGLIGDVAGVNVFHQPIPGQMQQLMTDADNVAGPQQRPADPGAVDVGAVGAVVVDQLPLTARTAQHRMPARDQQIIEHHIVVGATPDRHHQLINGMHRRGRAGHRRLTHHRHRLRRRRLGPPARRQLHQLTRGRRPQHHRHRPRNGHPLDAGALDKHPIAAVVDQNPAPRARLQHRMITRHPRIIQPHISLSRPTNRPHPIRRGMPDPPTSAHLQPGHIHHDRLGPTLHTQPPAPPPHNPKPLTTPRQRSNFASVTGWKSRAWEPPRRLRLHGLAHLVHLGHRRPCRQTLLCCLGFSSTDGPDQPYFAHQVCSSSMVAGSPKTSLSISFSSLVQITFGWFL
ncbi:hypothetical protein LAUMK40_04521 [Mycobacterium kansasii]|nr:hypothetical protein LAUMK40_04521 [Mycobacterium kansasii]